MALGHALLLTFSLLGGLTFVQADLPHIRADGSQLTGQVYTNFRHADVDGDGAMDILTARYIALQRDGAFPPEARIDLPLAEAQSTEEESSERPFCDLWGRELYLRHSRTLRVARWGDGFWKERLNQPVEWPDEPANGMTSNLQIASPEAAVRLERCLHDMDNDGVPEIILSGQEGLHIYALEDGEYANVNVLDVFPPLTTRPAMEQHLWPPKARRIQLPIRGMQCDFLVNGADLALIQRKASPGNETGSVHISRIKLDSATRFSLQSERWEHQAVKLSRLARPFSLNGDAIVDYVGYEMGGGRMLGRSFPVGGSFPVHETYASTDGGTTFQSFRVQGFSVGARFTDFDGDGDQDLITEPTKMFQGGIRETVSRMMTRRTFEHAVHVHLQDARGVFARKPDIKGAFTIQCEDALIRDEATLSRYRSGELVNVTGDFDGDGYNDVLLREQPHRLALYLNEGRGFSRKPAAFLSILSEQRFGVTDVDGDGRGDIVVMWAERKGDETELYNRVFLTRGDAP